MIDIDVKIDINEDELSDKLSLIFAKFIDDLFGTIEPDEEEP